MQRRYNVQTPWSNGIIWFRKVVLSSGWVCSQLDAMTVLKHKNVESWVDTCRCKFFFLQLFNNIAVVELPLLLLLSYRVLVLYPQSIELNAPLEFRKWALTVHVQNNY